MLEIFLAHFHDFRTFDRQIVVCHFKRQNQSTHRLEDIWFYALCITLVRYGTFENPRDPEYVSPHASLYSETENQIYISTPNIQQKFVRILAFLISIEYIQQYLVLKEYLKLHNIPLDVLETTNSHTYQNLKVYSLSDIPSTADQDQIRTSQASFVYHTLPLDPRELIMTPSLGEFVRTANYTQDEITVEKVFSLLPVKTETVDGKEVTTNYIPLTQHKTYTRYRRASYDTYNGAPIIEW